MFRALLCPSSGSRDYMCVVTAYGVQCLVAGCRGSGAGSRLCVHEEGCCTTASVFWVSLQIWSEIFLVLSTIHLYIIIIIISLVTGLFFLVLLLNQRCSPPLRLQASHCSTFRIMCDVPSIAVFCRESIECFPGTASKFLLKLLVTIPVAPVITGMI